MIENAFIFEKGKKEISKDDLKNISGYQDVTAFSGTNVETLANRTFLSHTSVKSIALNKLKIIGDFACMHCTHLEHFHFPPTLEVLGRGAFMYCTALQYCHFPENLQSIPYRAFNECKNLQAIYLPDQIQSIANQAFTRTGTNHLKYVIYGGNHPEVIQTILCQMPYASIIHPSTLPEGFHHWEATDKLQYLQKNDDLQRTDQLNGELTTPKVCYVYSHHQHLFFYPTNPRKMTLVADPLMTTDFTNISG